ncbi:hypothetical protein [Jiella pelagia]|uniref:Uncharacterized protein n=1 Tax=Jiella pelagia TaxID=2986949 RepID=A0ABY7C9A6_9HYPH|nr:hypothetical protein [Jiella pelagia]WAP70370.1 hypothetical protein OH818_10030 [Jiella pelagia]
MKVFEQMGFLRCSLLITGFIACITAAASPAERGCERLQHSWAYAISSMNETYTPATGDKKWVQLTFGRPYSVVSRSSSNFALCFRGRSAEVESSRFKLVGEIAAVKIAQPSDRTDRPLLEFWTELGQVTSLLQSGNKPRFRPQFRVFRNWMTKGPISLPILDTKNVHVPRLDRSITLVHTLLPFPRQVAEQYTSLQGQLSTENVTIGIALDGSGSTVGFTGYGLTALRDAAAKHFQKQNIEYVVVVAGGEASLSSPVRKNSRAISNTNVNLRPASDFGEIVDIGGALNALRSQISSIDTRFILAGGDVQIEPTAFGTQVVGVIQITPELDAQLENSARRARVPFANIFDQEIDSVGSFVASVFARTQQRLGEHLEEIAAPMRAIMVDAGMLPIVPGLDEDGKMRANLALGREDEWTSVSVWMVFRPDLMSLVRNDGTR